MAVRSMSERDSFAQTTNTPAGDLAVFDGSRTTDRRNGVLISVTRRIEVAGD